MYKQVVNVSTGVVNTVKEDKFNYLMKTGDYQEYKEPEKEEAPGDDAEKPKRKRRTKAEIEAEKAKE